MIRARFRNQKASKQNARHERQFSNFPSNLTLTYKFFIDPIFRLVQCLGTSRLAMAAEHVFWLTMRVCHQPKPSTRFGQLLRLEQSEKNGKCGTDTTESSTKRGTLQFRKAKPIIVCLNVLISLGAGKETIAAQRIIFLDCEDFRLLQCVRQPADQGLTILCRIDFIKLRT